MSDSAGCYADNNVRESCSDRGTGMGCHELVPVGASWSGEVRGDV